MFETKLVISIPRYALRRKDDDDDDIVCEYLLGASFFVGPADMQGLQGKRAFPASKTTTRIERRGTGGGRPGLGVGYSISTVPNVMQWKERAGDGCLFAQCPNALITGTGNWGGTTYL